MQLGNYELTQNRLRALAGGGMMALGGSLAIMGYEATPASAWAVSTSAEADCIQGPGNGTVEAGLTFANKETSDVQNTMDVTPEIDLANGKIIFGSQKTIPGQDNKKWNIAE